MAILFFYGRESGQFGPFSPTQMREHAADHRLLPTDLVWQQHTDRKVPALNVKNLFAIPPTLTANPPEPVVPPVTPVVAEDAPVPEPAKAAVPGATLPYVRDYTRKEVVRPMRVNRIRGGILLSQDGTHVKFTKKCEKCGKEDPCRSTALIRTGCMRMNFFCRTCRKSRQVELFGMS